MGEESKKYGAEGGKKRAANLTKEQRREAAKIAAAARWAGDLPIADYNGVLQIGDLQFPCAVLSDGTRVLTQSDFMSGMGMYYSGWVARNRSAEDKAADVPHFLGFKSLKSFIDRHLGDLQSIVVKYRTTGGKMALGIRAEIIPKICEIWVDADEESTLGPRQKQIAAKARLLMRALAYKGIEALVDNATGFIASRDQRDIAKFIQAYVAKDLRQWVRTFPRSFFEQLCRLRGIPFPDNMRLPQYFGHLVNDIVWDRLAPGIKDELRSRNPRVNGRRKHKHHQLLTENVGNPRLLHHLGLLEGLASGFEDGAYEMFRRKVEERFPSYKSLPLFSGIPETAKLPRAKKALPASSSGSDLPTAE
jgi:hypothetical protein